MSAYEEDKRIAEQRLKKVFTEKRLNNVQLRISRGHKVKWGPPLNPGWFGIPDGSRKYVVAPATINIDDWLKLQSKSGMQTDFGFNSFLAGGYEPTIAEAERSIQSGRKDIPTPVLEIKANGSVPQEGRSRAMGAKRGGAKTMPIWVAVQIYR